MAAKQPQLSIRVWLYSWLLSQCELVVLLWSCSSICSLLLKHVQLVSVSPQKRFAAVLQHKTLRVKVEGLRRETRPGEKVKWGLKAGQIWKVLPATLFWSDDHLLKVVLESKSPTINKYINKYAHTVTTGQNWNRHSLELAHWCTTPASEIHQRDKQRRATALSLNATRLCLSVSGATTMSSDKSQNIGWPWWASRHVWSKRQPGCAFTSHIGFSMVCHGAGWYCWQCTMLPFYNVLTQQSPTTLNTETLAARFCILLRNPASWMHFTHLYHQVHHSLPDLDNLCMSSEVTITKFWILFLL